MAKYKIWWQSSTVLGGLPGYKEAVEGHAKKVLGPDFELEMHGVPYGTNDLQYLYFERLNNQQVMESLFQAQKKGFDAIALGCFLDPCMQEAREILDIPVVGMAENSMMWAGMYGRTASIVTYDPGLASKRFTDLVHAYDQEKRVTSIISFEISLEALSRAFSEPEEALKEFAAACQLAVEKGAEVILPGCGLLNALAVQNSYSTVGNTGATVLDVTGALMKTAEGAIILQKECGMKMSRSSFYKSPAKESIDAVRKIYKLG